VEKNQNPSGQFIGTPTYGDDDPRVSLLILKVPPCQSLEVHPVVRQNGFPLIGGESQLFRISVSDVSSFLRRHHAKAARADQMRQDHVNVFVQVEVNEELLQRFATSGSIRSSGMRLRSM